MKKFLLLLIITYLFLFSAPDVFASSPYRIVREKQGIYIVEVNTAKTKYKLTPVYVSALETNNSVYNRLKPKFVVNAGFFDPKNQKTVSYVVIDGKVVLDPKDNENLMTNKVLEPYMDKILNRSEFRIYEDDKGKVIYDIAPHNDEIPKGYILKHSIQGGPLLFPDLKLEEEFFVLVRDGKIISESASALQKYARTAIGIRENKVYIFVITNEAPMTLEEIADLTHRWGMTKAMAFDGGGSTSFDSYELNVVSDKDSQARKLKSFLMLK
ncbi:MAG: phosphodiester glycosidase family protein [Candidatus Gastranaerophilales bacterium]|nr:phosphodiester glycosidase family protein [Candidatus Gastranaerophilales bacterium]